MPLKENAAIAALRQRTAPATVDDLIALAIDAGYPALLAEEQLKQSPMFQRWQHLEFITSMNGYRYNILRLEDRYYGVPWDLGDLNAEKFSIVASRSDVFSGDTVGAVGEQVIRHAGGTVRRLSASRGFLRRLSARIRRLFSQSPASS